MSLFSIVRKRNGTISWTKDQVRYIVNKYVEENQSIKQLSTDFGCSSQAIRAVLRKQDIPLKGNTNGYPRNSLYFYDINSADKAYWLGFLYADGCVSEKSNEISCSQKSKEHLIKLQQAIGAINHKIVTVKDNRFSEECIYYCFAIKDKQLHQDLIKWGCIPNKSLILSKIPNIPREYVSHFLRGYFDGDGSLHYLKNTNNYRISFTCGSKEFLEDIRHELQKDNLSIRKDLKHNVYQLQISGRKQVKKILDYLYKDSNQNIRLDRKYKLYLNCSEWAHSN